MKSKIMLLAGVIFVSLMIISSVSAIQFRPMNQMKHPGLTNPYNPPEDGPNHSGVSDYGNKFNKFWSELCECDHQKRPANQGYNIPMFFLCSGGD